MRSATSAHQQDCSNQSNSLIHCIDYRASPGYWCDSCSYCNDSVDYVWSDCSLYGLYADFCSFDSCASDDADPHEADSCSSLWYCLDLDAVVLCDLDEGELYDCVVDYDPDAFDFLDANYDSSYPDDNDTVAY